MGTYSKNGLLNTARPVAIASLVVLGVSIGSFFYCFSKIVFSKWRVPIRYGGIFSAMPLFFLSGKSHDLVINLSGAFGALAIFSILIVLYREQLYNFFWLGVFCLALCGINNYIYYTGEFLYALAVIQKISFAFFLLWFCLICIHLYKKIPEKETSLPVTN